MARSGLTVSTDSRTYWIGLPVGVTVQVDGTVGYEIDTSEAGDARLLFDGAPQDDSGVTLYADAQVKADAAIIDSADVAQTLTLSDAQVNAVRAALTLYVENDYDETEVADGLAVLTMLESGVKA